MASENGLEKAILNYLAKHPESKDTFEGIAEWWILKEHINRSVEDINQALNMLISKGYIEVREYPNQDRLYKINQNKFQEINKESGT